MLTRWPFLFANTDLELGRTNAVFHTIPLDDEIPFKERRRRIAPCMIDEVRQHLVEMLNCRIIRESKSPWASPIVLANKKDGTKRFCVDYQWTKKDSYYVPRINETFDALTDAKWFSSLDLKSGYWQLEVAESDKEKTAFTAGPLGLYEFNRMPFGLTSALATFQRLMENCLGDPNLRDCLIYLDNIVVFSRTLEEHLARLEEVFRRLKAFGSVPRSVKCFGHVISGVKILADTFEY